MGLNGNFELIVEQIQACLAYAVALSESALNPFSSNFSINSYNGSSFSAA